jgi:hypothetical protein
LSYAKTVSCIVIGKEIEKKLLQEWSTHETWHGFVPERDVVRGLKKLKKINQDYKYYKSKN